MAPILEIDTSLDFFSNVFFPFFSFFLQVRQHGVNTRDRHVPRLFFQRLWPRAARGLRRGIHHPPVTFWLICMPQMYAYAYMCALYVCLRLRHGVRRCPVSFFFLTSTCMYALYVCLVCMPYMYALYVCPICMPCMYALYV